MYPSDSMEETVKNEYVKNFYNSTASSFSATRRDPWPLTKNFIENNYTESSLILDVGCGNGRSLIRPNIIGLDISINLLKYARSLKSCFNPDLVLNDSINVPFKSYSFELVLSIAVVHHFLGAEGRRKAVHELFRVLKVGGRAFICVWTDRIKDQKKVYPMHEMSAQEYDENDCLISWNGNMENLRFYHLFKHDELNELVRSVGFDILESGEDNESDYVVVAKK